nr:hypothetical protein Iba_scaffold17804CG0270 [Ipomoea batatas]
MRSNHTKSSYLKLSKLDQVNIAFSILWITLDIRYALIQFFEQWKKI